MLRTILPIVLELAWWDLESGVEGRFKPCRQRLIRDLSSVLGNECTATAGARYICQSREFCRQERGAVGR
jgi:hypothetical protein